MLLFYRRTPYTLPRSYKRLTFAPFPPPPAPDSGSGAAPRRTLRGSHRPGCEGCTGRRPRTNPDPGCTVRGSPPPPPRIPAPLRGPTKPLTSPRSAPPFSGRRRVMEPGKDPGAASRRRCGFELRPRPLPFLRGWPRRGPAPPALAAPLRAAAAVPLLRHDAVAPRSAGSGAAPMRGAAAVRNSARGSLLRPPPRFPFIFFAAPSPLFPPFSALFPSHFPLAPTFSFPFPLSPFHFCPFLFFPFYIVFPSFFFSSVFFPLPLFFLPFPVFLFPFHFSLSSIFFSFFSVLFRFFPYFLFFFLFFFFPSLPSHFFFPPFIFPTVTPTAPPSPAPFSSLSPASPLPLLPAAAPPGAAGAVCPAALRGSPRPIAAVPPTPLPAHPPLALPFRSA